MPRSRYASVSAVVLAGLLAASCSNSQSSANRRPHRGSATASIVGDLQQVTVQATNTYRFEPSTITVHPGKVQIVLVNTGKPGQAAPHNWSLLGLQVATPLATAGSTVSVTFTAPSPGTYTFVCTIHQKQGQTGKLVVLPS
jgi:plastocyanin